MRTFDEQLGGLRLVQMRLEERGVRDVVLTDGGDGVVAALCRPPNEIVFAVGGYDHWRQADVLGGVTLVETDLSADQAAEILAGGRSGDA